MAFEKEIELPKYLVEMKNGKKTICIDEGIEHVLRELWKHNVRTLGCCSGHEKDRPSIIVADHYDNQAIGFFKQTISLVDDRDWKILQWNLIEV